MRPRLFAFDLDGTLLKSDKSLSAANLEALKEMAHYGIVALASGRLGSSVRGVPLDEAIDPALLTLNGGAVYTRVCDGSRLIYSATLPATYADELIEYGEHKDFAVNYYHDGKLFAIRTNRCSSWNDLYFKQTATPCTYLYSLRSFRGNAPHKIIFVGDPVSMDREERSFRARWEPDIYIVRSWTHYLEFLNPDANKGSGMQALAAAYDMGLEDVIAFGDADNDIPMLQRAGMGIAVANATPAAKAAARYISAWTNDQDAIAHEWKRLRRELA